MNFGEQRAADDGARVIPCLPSRDIGATAAFYGALGFRTHDFDGGYLIAVKDWVELHFRAEPAMEPLKTAESCYIRVLDVDAVAASLGGGLPAKGFPSFRGPINRDWGMREAYLFDVDNNLIKIGTPLRAPA